MEPAAFAAVLTVSDGVTAGTRVDESGEVVEELLRTAGFDVERSVVRDERRQIEARQLDFAGRGVPLVVTTGGTGFGPRDVTPEATRSVIDREAPGLAEVMRAAGLEKTPLAALSRGVVGSRGATMIVNLPGSPKGARESLEAVLPVLPHAVEVLGGQTGSHPTGHAEESAVGFFPAGYEDTLTEWVEVRAVKVDGSPPCRVGNRMSIVPGGPVRGTLGCAEFDEAAISDAAAIHASGEPQTRTYTHADGTAEVYFEPHLPPPRLILVSATDVARALRWLVAPLGYHTVIVEPRGERTTAKDRDRGVVPSIERLELDERDHVVLTDHDAPHVTETLAAALRSPARFIGVMGSRGHVGPYMEELKGMGFADDDLARIHSPVGLNLGGQRPEEIALSIAAGLVAAKHSRDGGWLDRRV